MSTRRNRLTFLCSASLVAALAWGCGEGEAPDLGLGEHTDAPLERTLEQPAASSAVASSALVEALSIATPTQCQEDEQGANDEPGQKDLTLFCVDPGEGDYELYSSWNWDLVALPGGNTIDGCTLYDNDDNGNADFVVCVTGLDGGGPPHLGDVRLFTCRDSRPDRCPDAEQVLGNECWKDGSFTGTACSTHSDCDSSPAVAETFRCMPGPTLNTRCELSQKNNDPFPAGDSYPQDSEALCAIDLDDIKVCSGGANNSLQCADDSGCPDGTCQSQAEAVLIDACSYPSAEVNSDPSDCIRDISDCDFDADCDDGNACTINSCVYNETLNKNICRTTPDAGAVCGAGDVCSVDICSEQGFCVEENAPPGTVCTDTIADCYAAQCDGAGLCDQQGGYEPPGTACGSQEDTDCNNPDTCDGAGACTDHYEDSSTPCEDGLFCTSTSGEPGTTDNCNGQGNGGAACVGGPVSCDDGLYCTGIETCNDATDTCDASGDPCPGTECNTCQEDSDSCFDDPGTACGSPNDDQCDNPDTCDGAGACEDNYEVRGFSCEDGAFCTSVSGTPGDADACDGVGGCFGGPVSCDDGLYCTGGETCNEDNDTCDSTGDPCPGTECNHCQEDSDSCFDDPGTACGSQEDTDCNNPDSCDGAGACTDYYEDSSTLCEDGLFCTSTSGEPGTTDNCNGQGNGGAACVGGPVNCDDGLYCTGSETCNDDTNTCDSSGDPCSGTECNTCQEDADSCFDDPGTACGSPNDDQCDNPDTCDGTGVCEENYVVRGFSCEDGAFCTSVSGTPGDLDACDGVGGCFGGPVNCDDGLYCTGGEDCNEDNDTCDSTGDPCPGTVCNHCQEDSDSCFDSPETPCGDDTDSECTDPDRCDGAGSCSPNNTDCGMTTDSSLCQFDVEPGKDGRQFRVNFSPDIKNWVAYKLNSTNPGQYFYNLFSVGTPGEVVTFQIEIPWPFVTQGATPIHVYDGALVGSANGCFFPPQDALDEQRFFITTDDWATGLPWPGDAERNNLVCTPVSGPEETFGGSPVSGLCTFDVDATYPPSGLLYVNVHLDFALKGHDVDANPVDGLADRYDRAAALSEWGTSDALVNTDTGDGEVALLDCRDFNFGHWPGGDSVEPIQNLNTFKRIAGVFGRVYDQDDLIQLPGVHVELWRGIDFIAETTTDEEGYFAIEYKHKGKADSYSVIVRDVGACGDIVQDVTLQSNGWWEVNVIDDPECVSTAETAQGKYKSQ